MKYLKYLFLGIFLVSLSHCGGGNDIVVIPGTMNLSSEIAEGPAAEKFSFVAPEEAEVDTQMTARVREEGDFFILDILDFFAEGSFPTDGSFRFFLDPEGESSGKLSKLDENGEPTSKHQINLDLMVEINDQKAPIPDVTVGGFSEQLDLEVEVAPIEYRNGANDIRVMKLNGLKKFTNIVFKRGLVGTEELIDE